MARTVTLGSMRDWARQLSDTENDDNVTDAELTALVNRHLAEVYDLLVESGPPDYYASSTTVSAVADTIQYALPADFRNLTAVYVHESDDERRPLPPMPTNGRGRYKAPASSSTVTLEYISAPSTLSSSSDTFDGVSGWEALIVNRVALDIMKKRQADPSVVLADIASLTARITARSKNRDRGAPKRVVDLDEQYTAPWPTGWTGSSTLAAYRLRAGNIELYDMLWCPP